MDTEIKRKWVEALRSGEHEQGRQMLSQNGKTKDVALCCIGVGIVVARPDLNVDRLDTSQASRLLGLSLQQEQALVSLNDDDGESFAQIADYIEAHL